MPDYRNILKARVGLPLSNYCDSLWGKQISPSVWKTLTGKLPLFFRTSDTKLRDWVIFGNNDVGKNLISVVNVKGVSSGVTITNTDEMTGSIEAETTSGRTYRNVWWTPEFEEGQTYILSCYVNEVNGYARLTFRRKSNDSVIASAWFTSTGMKAAQITYTSESYPEGVYVALMLNGSAATAGEINVSEIMLRKADTSEDFEPYQLGVGEKTENGYVLNIGVGFAPIPAVQPVALVDTRKTIYIGESPLTEGQTLSMSEFGDIETQPYADMFIAAFEGFNYDDQLSYNQPRMRIKYKEYKE